MSYFDENTPDIVLKSLFQKYDTDNSGLISMSEIPQLLRGDLGLNGDEAETYTLLLDKDASGKLSFDEFKDWLNSGEKLRNIEDSSRFYLMQKAVDMFKAYDKDQSGALDRNEFYNLHLDVGGNVNNLDSALQALDKDHNGKVSFYEFLKWLNWIDVGNF